MASDVACARRWSSRRKRASSGTRTMPPPTPSSPLASPPAIPNLGPPVLAAGRARTRLSLPLAVPLEPSVVSARRSRFLVEIAGAVLAAVPGDSLPAEGLLSAVKFKREPGGVLLDLALAPEARGYRVHVPE